MEDAVGIPVGLALGIPVGFKLELGCTDIDGLVLSVGTEEMVGSLLGLALRLGGEDNDG